MKLIIVPMQDKEEHVITTLKAFDPYCTIKSKSPIIVYTVTNKDEIQNWTSVKSVDEDNETIDNLKFKYQQNFNLTDFCNMTKGLSPKSIISFVEDDLSLSSLSRKWTNLEIDQSFSTATKLIINSTNNAFTTLHLFDIEQWMSTLMVNNPCEINFNCKSHGFMGFVVAVQIKAHPTLLVPELQLSFKS